MMEGEGRRRVDGVNTTHIINTRSMILTHEVWGVQSSPSRRLVWLDGAVIPASHPLLHREYVLAGSVERSLRSSYYVRNTTLWSSSGQHYCITIAIIVAARAARAAAADGISFSSTVRVHSRWAPACHHDLIAVRAVLSCANKGATVGTAQTLELKQLL